MKKKSAGRKIKGIDCTRHELYKVSVDFASIKSRREKLNLSQTEAAKRAGFRSQQHWAGIENAKPDTNPRVKTLAAVAMVLGCKVDDLLRKR